MLERADGQCCLANVYPIFADNGMVCQISGLSKAAEVLEECGSTALELAEGAAAFIKKSLYDEVTGELRRSYREGPGPTGQADDYAFLIQGTRFHCASCSCHADLDCRSPRPLRG